MYVQLRHRSDLCRKAVNKKKNDLRKAKIISSFSKGRLMSYKVAAYLRLSKEEVRIELKDRK